MMEDGEDFPHVRLHAIEKTVGKVQQDGASQARTHFRVELRMRTNPCNRRINRRGELVSESLALRLVPRALPGVLLAPPGGNESAASSAALKQLVPDLIPRDAGVGVCVRIGNAAVQFSALRVTQWQRIRMDVRFLSDAVPDILDETKALVDREVMVVEGWFSHDFNMPPIQGKRKRTDPQPHPLRYNVKLTFGRSVPYEKPSTGRDSDRARNPMPRRALLVQRSVR
jgi:hypothetical protein